MDGFNRLSLHCEEEEKWTTVGSPDKRQSSSSDPTKSSQPLIVSHNCPFSIYQMPKFSTDETVLQLVNDVVETGLETKQLFLEVTSKTYPKHLVILRGVPGSGKSSVANALMATTRKGTICSADDYFNDSKGNYNFNPGRLSDAHQECQSKAKRLMEKDISPVIIDNTNTRRFEMEPYVKMAVENNYSITVFEPETPWKMDARVLAQRNIHRVPREKIQEMIDRFEQIVPYMLLEDVKKRMGEVGKKYNPGRANFEEELKHSTLSPMTPLLGATKLESLIPPLMSMKLKESRRTGDKSASAGAPPRPNPLLSEFVLNTLTAPSGMSGGGVGEWLNENFDKSGGYKRPPRMAAIFPCDESIMGLATCGGSKYDGLTDQKASFSAGGMNQKKKVVQSEDSPSSAQALKGVECNRSMSNPLVADRPSSPKLYTDSVLNAAQTLQAYFPTYKMDELADLVEKYDENIDEAMNALLDLGYAVAEEVIFTESDKNQKDHDNKEIYSDFTRIVDHSATTNSPTIDPENSPGSAQAVIGVESRSKSNPLVADTSSPKLYTDSVLKASQTLQAYFPTYKIDELADLVEKYDENIDDAMNALLDSGYAIAEEVVFTESDENQKDYYDNQEIHSDLAGIVGNSATTNSPTIDPETVSLDDFDSDYFNLKVPQDFIEKLTKMYGHPDDPIVKSMLQYKNGINTPVPSGMGFSMYLKLIQNAEAKAFKEAEEAAEDK